MEIRKISIKNLGPIHQAEMEAGDLTVLVGPQATGKSLCLQSIKLFLDAGNIKEILRENSYDWHKKKDDFLSLFFGEGMNGAWGKATQLVFNDQPISWTGIESRRYSDPRAYYIPAQRVMTMENSWPRPFTSLDSSYPFVVREFSESIRFLLESLIRPGRALVFPGKRKLRRDVRRIIFNSIFREAYVVIERKRNRREAVLRIKSDNGWKTISAGSWSAGQREFVPMLLGMYHLMPTGKGPRRGKLRVAMVEEIEMGLHPEGVAGAIMMLMELIGRGYQVFVSTHSPTVLDFMWAVRNLKAKRGTSRQFMQIFGIDKPSLDSSRMAEKCLEKKFKVHYFEPSEHIRRGVARTGVAVKDISDLDPGSADTAMSGWGGLTEFSSRAAEVVAELNHSSRRS